MKKYFNSSMKKLTTLLLSAIFLFSFTPQAKADLMPPATDVSCGVNESGLVCSNNIVFSSSFTVVGQMQTQWNIWRLKSGQNPTLVSSYEGQTIYSTNDYMTGSISFTYDYLLKFLNSDANGTFLIGATSIQKISDSTLSNANGRRFYYSLNDLKVAIDKAIADAAKAKADAEAAKAKAAQDADAAKAAQQDALAKIAAQKAQFNSLKAGVMAQLTTLNNLMAKQKANMSVFKSFAASTEARLKTLEMQINVGAASDEDFGNFTTQFKQLYDPLLRSSQGVTISCQKNKVTKKITGLKPVCPAGFKRIS